MNDATLNFMYIRVPGQPHIVIAQIQRVES